jgi:hypothetical protein
MDSASDSTSEDVRSMRIEQISLPLPWLEADEEESEIVNEIAGLSIAVQQRMEGIQQVMAVRGTERYGKVQRQGAKKLGLSVRSCRVSNYFSFRLKLFFRFKRLKRLLCLCLSVE